MTAGGQREQHAGDLAAILLDLRDAAGTASLPRSAVLAAWKQDRPESARRRSGARLAGRTPGTRAGHHVRQALVDLERRGLVTRDGSTVRLLDLAALDALAES